LFYALSINLTLATLSAINPATENFRQTFEQDSRMPDVLHVAQFIDIDEDELQSFCLTLFACKDSVKLATWMHLCTKPSDGLKQQQLLIQFTNLPPPAL